MEKLFLYIRTIFFVLLIPACDSNFKNQIQGYVEADYIYISPLNAGKIKKINVKKGQEVGLGQQLFILDDEPFIQQSAQANNKLSMERAKLSDMQTGLRKTELDVLRMQLESALEAEKLAYSKLQRNKKQSAVISKFELEQFESDYLQKHTYVLQLKNNLTANALPSRQDQILAQQSAVQQAQKALEEQLWYLKQRTLSAPGKSVVSDILYHTGEWVPAGRPVLSLLPDDNIKIRFFVSSKQLARIKLSEKISFFTSNNNLFSAEISYISSAAEYTPPVIYSNNRKEKLVFMIEAIPDSHNRQQFHPGMPVTVRLSE